MAVCMACTSCARTSVQQKDLSPCDYSSAKTLRTLVWILRNYPPASRALRVEKFWNKRRFFPSLLTVFHWGHGDALSSLRLPPWLLVQLVIFWDLVNKHSQSLTTTKTNDCEISFRAISSSPAKTHCIHMHEIACVNTYYESWVMRWIILSAHNNATASAIRLETIAKPGPCGNILVNCHVWIIKQYTEH